MQTSQVETPKGRFFIDDLEELLESHLQSPQTIIKRTHPNFHSQQALPRNFDYARSVTEIANSPSPPTLDPSLSLPSSFINHIADESDIKPEVYTTFDFQGFEPIHLPLKKAFIKAEVRPLFDRFDYDKSNTLHYTELYPLMNEITTSQKLQPLLPIDVLYLLHILDPIGAGRIHHDELVQMLGTLAGKKLYTKETVLAQREKRLAKQQKTDGQVGAELGF